jgi:hypothetical protein
VIAGMKGVAVTQHEFESGIVQDAIVPRPRRAAKYIG